jgi:alpha-galactosidase
VIEVRASGPLDVTTRESVLGSGTRVDIALHNPSRRVIILHAVTWTVDGWSPELVLEHGYQSWSVVRRASPGDVRPERLELPSHAVDTHFGHADAVGEVVAGDQFLVTDKGVIGWLDARSHVGAVEARDDGRLVAIALLDGVALPAGGTRTLDPLWAARGGAGALYSEFANHWGVVAGARIPDRHVAGWCSWYEYFAAVTPADIRSNTALAASHGLDAVQIDDGYQAAIGDWLDTCDAWSGDEWSGGTAALADEIRSAGMQAGIWTAPFLVAEASALYARHPEWTTTHASGHPSRAAYNGNNWGGWTFGLDTTRQDVLDHLRATYTVLVAQGFDYHKIDFCYAGGLRATRSDPTKTRAEALRMGLDAVRAGIGEDAFLLGCGCPFGPAVGVVDAMRVSADVAPRWDAGGHWPGLAESAPAAKNAIAASVLRAPLHRRVFLNDPDCLLIRPTGTSLDERQRSLLTEVVAGTGAFLLLSDDLSRYTDHEWSVVEQLRADQPALDVPLDIVDPFSPAVVVRSPAHTLVVEP